MKAGEIFLKILNIGKWPFYIKNIYLNSFQQYLWRKNKVLISGKNIQWVGYPIIVNAKDAIIEMGNDCLVCSLSEYTALGVSHPVILRTLKQGAKLRIGDRVRMSGATICAASSIIIGNRCVIGADVIIADTDFHALDPEIRSSPKDALLAKSDDIYIGDDVFIGGRSIILKGVRLGDKVIVGAGSIVTGSFPSGSIIAGNPAKKIGSIPL